MMTTSKQNGNVGRLFTIGIAAMIAGVTTLSCLFIPNIEDTGYNACESEQDCAPGRYCGLGLCVPPDWAEPDYKQRQLLIVENRSAEVMAAGTAIEVEIGPNGAVPLANFGGLGRLSAFDGTQWSQRTSYFDRFVDRFVAFVPLPQALGAGESVALAWIETNFEPDRPAEPNLGTTDDTDVFMHFIGFEPEVAPPLDGGPDVDSGPGIDGGIGVDGGIDVDAGVVVVDAGPPAPVIHDLTDERFRIFGDPVVVRDGVATIKDNNQVSLRTELFPPFRLTFVGRFNNTTCSRVFFGVRGQTGIGYAAPSVEFSVGSNLEGLIEIAPGAADTPNAISSPAPLDNVTRRYSIEVTEKIVRADIDGLMFAEREILGNGFDAEVPLFVVLDVDGNNCSFDLEEIRVTHGSLPRPQVRANAPVEYVAYKAP